MAQWKKPVGKSPEHPKNPHCNPPPFIHPITTMGMLLLNDHFLEFEWNMGGWRDLLGIACHHGWKPRGTRLLKQYCRIAKDKTVVWSRPVERLDRRWKGGYMSNDGQIVTARDAAALADALARSLRYIPDQEQPEETWEEDVYAPFSGPVLKNNLRMFIIFCRKGKFQIR